MIFTFFISAALILNQLGPNIMLKLLCVIFLLLRWMKSSYNTKS